MKLLVTIILVFLSLNLTAQSVFDGFFKGKNKLDAAYSIGFQSSKYYYPAVTKFKYERQLFMMGLFGEYGVTDKFDVILNVPFIASNLQDGGIFLKYKLFNFLNEKLAIIPAAGYSLALSNYNTESKFSIGQQATTVHSRLIAQAQLPFGFYLQGQVGYLYNFKPVPSAVVASAKLCWSYGKWYVDTWFEMQKGQGDITFQGPKPVPSFRYLKVDYNRVGGVIYRQLSDKWGVFVNASQILSGVDTFDTFSLNTGFVKKFNFGIKPN
jgi:hypothetical protein